MSSAARDLGPGFNSSLQVRPEWVNTQRGARRLPPSTQIPKPGSALGLGHLVTFLVRRRTGPGRLVKYQLHSYSNTPWDS